jgi:two-component system, chemotaxis family, response regulator Rcp1
MFEVASDARRIVVIEDSPADANLLRIALEKAGARLEIQVIADGMQALAYFESAASKNRLDSDLVLLDLNVPIINGFEILERIKGHRNLKKLPVIILSGSSNTDDIERCYQAGANCYLCKPGGLTEFFEMVAGMVDYWLRCAKLPSRAASEKISAPAS